MKRIKIFLLIIAVIIVISTLRASAQKKAERTSSARAYYGISYERPKPLKAKKQKVDWRKHAKPAKGTQSNAWATRKRYARV